MNNNPTHNPHESVRNLQEKILEKIRMKKLTMRPKAYFTIIFIAMVMVSVLILGVTLFIFSYMVFSIRASSDLFLLGFGLKGLLLFFLFFPWKFFLIDIILIFLLEWILRQFSFGYKRSIIYILMGILVVLITSSILIEKEIHFHTRLENMAGHEELPVIGGMYSQLRRSPPHDAGVCRCIVTDIQDNVLTVVDDNRNFGSTTIEIFLPNAISTSTIHIGDRIFVAGDIVNGQIHAYGIRMLNPED